MRKVKEDILSRHYNIISRAVAGMANSGPFGATEAGIVIADAVADGIKEFPMDETLIEEVFAAAIAQLEKQSNYL